MCVVCMYICIYVLFICVCTYIHMYVCMHVCVYVCIYLQRRTIFKVSHMFFINVAVTLIGYRKPPILDYYFITNTGLVPVAVST